VPPAQTIAALLQQVGGPVVVQGLGLAATDQTFVEQNAHYLRNRFTVRKLARVLGMA